MSDSYFCDPGADFIVMPMRWQEKFKPVNAEKFSPQAVRETGGQGKTSPFFIP
jgi:hypothetical protein